MGILYLSTVAKRILYLRICVFVTCVLGSLHGFTQQPDVRLSIFRQNNFTYSTNFDLQYEFSQDRYQFTLITHHDNLINSTRRDQPFVQVYVHTDFWQYYRINKRWEVASWYLSDQFFNTENQRYNIYAGFRYKWNKFLEIRPFIGYSWDFRAGIWDNGVSPGMILSSQYVWPDGFKMRTNIFARLKYISPRHQRDISFQSFWTKALSGITDVAINVRGGTHQIDSYRLNSIEGIKSDTIAPEIRFRYQLLPGLFWDSNNGLAFSRRAFEYEPISSDSAAEFNDLSFNHIEFYSQQKLSYGSAKLNGFIQFGFEDLNRRYSLENSQELPEARFQNLLTRERQKDFGRRMTLWELTVRYQPLLRHQFVLSGSNRYIQHDTPSDVNFDDHDELNNIVSLEWKARWARNFSTNYKLIGNIRRYSFLFRERSEDNYTQRALRMNFGYKWNILERLNMEGSQFIYVTYNVKDFDDPNFTDRATRNLESRVEFNHRASNRWEMGLTAYRKEVHLSYLDWENFTETTLDTNIIYILEHKQTLRMKQSWKNHLLFADVGYKHVSQSRRLNTTFSDSRNSLQPINLVISNLQTGPVTGIRLKKRSPASLELSVWWQWQFQDFKTRETEILITSNGSYRAEQLANNVSEFRPFFQFLVNLWIGK